MCQDADDDDWDENDLDWDDDEAEQPLPSRPPSTLDRESEPIEIMVAVRLQASLCDLENHVNILDLRRAATEAVANAVRHHEEAGFNHFLAEIVSLKVLDIRPLNAEQEDQS
jgi:hypothetical protein